MNVTPIRVCGPALTALLVIALAPGDAQAGASANVGFQSEYIFRGLPQAESSGQFGIDFDSNGLYAGFWSADVDDGLEYDLYGGYTFSPNDLFSFTVGYTGYFYTDDFDDTYQEINLGLGIDWFSLTYNIGEYDNFTGPTQDYGFLSLSFEYEGFFGTWGSFNDDFDGDYVEIGYGFEVAGLDVSAAFVHSTDDLLGDEDNNFWLGIGKSFDLSD